MTADATFTCPHCQQELEVPDELWGERVNCPNCEGELDLARPKRRLALATSPDAIAEEPLSTPIIEAPPVAAPSVATVAPPPEDACPSCQQPIPAGNVLCTNCGYDTRSGKSLTTKTRCPPADVVYLGWPLIARIIVGGLIATPFLLGLLGIVGEIAKNGMNEDTTAGLIGVSFALVVIVAVTGTFQRLAVALDGSGEHVLTRSQFLAFFPCMHRRHVLARGSRVELMYDQGLGAGGWLFVLLLVCFGLIPGLLFWHWAVNKDNFRLKLVTPDMEKGLRLYKGGSDRQQKQITAFLANYGVSIQRVDR